MSFRASGDGYLHCQFSPSPTALEFYTRALGLAGCRPVIFASCFALFQERGGDCSVGGGEQGICLCPHGIAR